MTTCNIAIPEPIKNRELTATKYEGNNPNRIAPPKATRNARIITFFSPRISISIPEGIDITPYAIKKAKGKRATNVRLRSKSSMI